MAKTDRVQNVQTPGVDQTQADDTASQADTAAELSTEQPAAPAVAPDIAALVAAEVARQMAQKTQAPAVVKAAPLPTQEEALKKVLADPKRRSVLSVDGWVTATAPQPAGFAKA